MDIMKTNTGKTKTSQDSYHALKADKTARRAHLPLKSVLEKEYIGLSQPVACTTATRKFA